MLVHQMINTLCTCILPLDLAIHVAFMFVVEGQKMLFRLMYAIIELSKDEIMKLETKTNIMGILRAFF